VREYLGFVPFSADAEALLTANLAELALDGLGSAELVEREAADPQTHVTVVLPRRSYSALLGRLLHDRTADKIAAVVSRIPRSAATIIPYDVESRVRVLAERHAAKVAATTLDTADRLWIPVRRSWRLNERHYGALQGLDKAEIKDRYGEEQFMAWRRSYDTPPPPIEAGSKFSQDADPRYADIGGGPLTECLADVVARFLPYFTDVIVPDLRVGKTVLIAAHGNSLRALVKYLDGMSDDDVVSLNIPTGIPLRYDLDADMKPTVIGGGYLDPEAAAAGAAAVASQGAR